MKTVLVLNTGSSSVKASLLCKQSSCEATFNTHTRLITAHAERLGTQESSLHITIFAKLIHRLLISSCVNTFEEIDPLSLKETESIEIAKRKMDHNCAIQTIIELIRSQSEALFSSITAVGHRVVHGGTLLLDAIVINETVLQSIENVTHLAPL